MFDWLSTAVLGSFGRRFLACLCAWMVCGSCALFLCVFWYFLCLFVFHLSVYVFLRCVMLHDVRASRCIVLYVRFSLCCCLAPGCLFVFVVVLFCLFCDCFCYFLNFVGSILSDSCLYMSLFV